MLLKETMLSLLFILAITITFQAHSQVKMGDNPNTIDSNSLLEMESGSQGVLIPRMALNDASTEDPMTAPVPEGMMIYNDGGSEQEGFYYWDGSQWRLLLTSLNSNVRDNHVLVKSASDLPAPSGGIITLSSNVVYEINGTIFLTDQIDPNEAYIIGQDVNSDRLIYTSSSGALFTGNNGGTIKTVTLAATPAGSQIFDLEDLTATKTVVIRDCIVANSDDIGLIKGYNVVFGSIINFSGNKNGITYENITHLLLENMAWFFNNSNTFETFVGTFSIIEKLGGFSEPLAISSATAVDVTGVASISNGEIKNTAFTGSGTRVNGTFTKQWEVESTGIDTETDDVASGNVYISSPTLTTIASLNTPVKISGITIATNLFRFTSPANNRMMYDGTKTRKFETIASLSISSSSNNKNFSFYLAKNGSILPESKQQRKMSSSGDIGALSLTGIVSLAPGDYVEVWVENNTDATDITIQSMNLSIK